MSDWVIKLPGAWADERLTYRSAMQISELLHDPEQRATTRELLFTLTRESGGDSAISIGQLAEVLKATPAAERERWLDAARRSAGLEPFETVDAREAQEAATARSRATSTAKGLRRLIRRGSYFTDEPPPQEVRVRITAGGAIVPDLDEGEAEASRLQVEANSREAARQAEQAERQLEAERRAEFEQASEQRFASELPPHLRP